MRQHGNHIYADDGKVFRRIVSGEIYGAVIALGYTYYIGGVLQNPPHLDVPEDFEEVDEPDEKISDTQALQIITGQGDE